MGSYACQAIGRRVDWGWWTIAFDQYALVAAALGQLHFEEAVHHKRVVAEVAARASASKNAGRSAFLGVLYDELAR